MPSHSPRIFLCVFPPPHILNLNVNVISLRCPFLLPAFPLMHTLLSQLSATSHLRETFLLDPWEESSDLFQAHISPTGSDLARTWAALGVMNHRFIFLGHMWVKLFDVNHTLTVSICNRRVIGCHSSPLAAPSPCTVLLLEKSTFLWLTFPDPFYWMRTTVYFGWSPSIQWLPMPIQHKNS